MTRVPSIILPLSGVREGEVSPFYGDDGVMSCRAIEIRVTSDPSVGVRRRHLPLSESAKGRL